ncbi:MAG TPA: VWA domain-containing protein [Thermoanaerobaculia bacterium]|nr:VWA domain-containing protein [Thermoanaerobaculia bacterium]
MRSQRFLVAALVLLAVPLVLRAQDEPVAAATVQVNLVEIPVNVIDRSGNPIRGLEPENFEVYDDGQRRRITHFEEIDLATISTAEPELSMAAARRNFMILFDLSHSSPSTILRGRDAAREFIHSLPRQDLASVATYSVEDGFRIVTAFTTDRDHLLNAVRTLGFTRFYQTLDPLQLSGAPGMAESRGIPDHFVQMELEEIAKLAQSRIQANEDNIRRNRIERQLESFGNLARLLNSVRGRKQILLLSEGFDSRLVQGREKWNTQQVQLEQDALMRGEVWRVDNDDRFGSSKALNDLRKMGRLFRASDVVLHAIDIKGLRAPNDPRSGSQNTSNESLFLISRPTGGDVFKNSNDLADSFARMLKQQEVVYILGFQTAPSGNPGKFHDLKVEVRVVGHSGLRVSHRAGYYEPRLQVNAVEQMLSATDILMNDIPFQDVRTSVLAAPFVQKEGNAEVPVIVEMSGKSLLDRVPGDVVNGELFIYAFDANGSVKDYLFQIFSLDLTKVRGVLSNSGLKYYGTLSLPPGDYAVKTLVRVLESGHNGFTRTAVRVPEYGEQAILPPLWFEEPDQWILLRGVSKAGGDMVYPFTLAGESFIPSARPRLALGTTHRLAMFTYNLPGEEMKLRARLDAADGSQQSPELDLVGRTVAGPNGAVKVLLEFTPEGIAPGHYSLHVVFRSAEREVEASLPLQIVSAGDSTSSGIRR